MGIQDIAVKTDDTGIYICEGIGDNLLKLVRYHLSRKKSILFITENTAHLEDLRVLLKRSGVRCSTIEQQTENRAEQTPAFRPNRRYHESRENDQSGRPAEKSSHNTFTAQQLSQMYTDALAELKKSGRTMKPLPFPQNVQESDFSFWQGLSYANLLANVYIFRALATQVFGYQSGILTDPGGSISLVSACADLLQRTSENFSRFKAQTGVFSDDHVLSIEKALKTTSVITSAFPIDKNILLSDLWKTKREVALDLIDKITAIQGDRQNLLSRFRTRVLDRDIETVLMSYQRAARSPLKKITREFSQLTDQIFKMYRGNPPADSKRLMADLGSLVSYRRRVDEIQRFEQTGKDLFGQYWDGEKSNPETLKALTKWILIFRQYVRAGYLTEESAQIAGKKIDQTRIIDLSTKISKSLLEFQQKFISLYAPEKRKDEIFSAPHLTVEYMENLLKMAKRGITGLEEWRAEKEKMTTPYRYVFTEMEQHLREGDITPAEILTQFKGNYADWRMKAFRRRASDRIERRSC